MFPSFKKRVSAFVVFLFALSLLPLISCRNEPTPVGVRIRMAAEPRGLNPLLAVDGTAQQIGRLVFQPLLDYDPETLAEEPVLAAGKPKVTAVDTGALKGQLRLDYTIRDNAQWDNNTPITGLDYLFTLKTIAAPTVKATAARSQIQNILDVVVDSADPKNFSVFVKKNFLSEVNCNGIPVLPQYAYDPENTLAAYSFTQLIDKSKLDNLSKDTLLLQFAEQFQSPDAQRDAQKAVGSGPYRIVSWSEDGQIALQRKEDWWGKSIGGNLFTATMPEIIFMLVKDLQAALTMLKNNEIDIVTRLTPAMFQDLKADVVHKDDMNFYEPATLEIHYLGLNTKNPTLADLQVRQALAHVTNIRAITDSIYLGLAKPATGPIHPSKSIYNDTIKTPEYNPAKAMQLLDAAGWKDQNGNGTRDKKINGKTTELKIGFAFVATNELAKNIGLYLQEEARKIGIAIELQPQEAPLFSENLAKRNFDIFSAALGTELPPDELRQFWHTASNTPDGSNRFGFGSAESDALIESMSTITDQQALKNSYWRFQELIAAQQPAIFLCTPLERIVTRPNVRLKTTIKRPSYIEGAIDLK
jgi:peptide/nickel transport system substrate-binding protein